MNLQNKRVAILIGPQFHDEETPVPRDYLRALGAEVDVVGLDDSELTGKYGRLTLKPDKTIHQIKVEDYDGIIIPGGGAPERIRVDETALRFVREFWKTGRPIGVICHGPQVLISAKVLEGVKLTCYVGIRDDVINAGAIYVDEPVCVDGQVISSRKPEDLPFFNKAFAEALAGHLTDAADRDLDPLSALEVAVSREKGAMDFYTNCSNQFQEPRVKNKFAYLAAIEKGHFEQLSDLYRKLSGGKEPKVDVSKTELSGKTVAPDITAEQAVDLGIRAEEKAYEFYRAAAAKSKGKKVKEMFEYLAAEELEHKRLLLLDKAVAEGGQGHFQWATHFDIPPGMEDLW
ncbi:MAG: DJ-1/PfpI/YhbO family deglycase/protease [candidate division KSB1 bacterium]|nr:DJ-1/PfpI/YhbO family deglycase/protease [candidate division KSB1 bacterium]